MAFEDIAPGMFGQFPDMSGALSPEQAQALQSNAAKQALLASAVTMLGMSGAQRVPVSTGQALGAALGAGLCVYQGAFDNTLKQMIAAQQMADYRKKAEARSAYEKAIAGATTMQPQAIPMAQGQGSQLEMLSRPEFGGGMANAETLSALEANLPMVKRVNPEAANTAALDYLRSTDPAKFLELTAKADTMPSDIKSTLAYMNLSPEQKATYERLKTLSAAKTTFAVNTADPTAVAKAGMDVTKQFTDLTKDSRERAARFNSIVSAAKDPENPATDATLIYNTAKILDPTGAVQQGDLKTIIGNPSIPQRVQVAAQTLSRGGSLSKDQRDDLIANAYNIIKADEKNIAPIVANYKDFASSFKVDTNKIESPYKDIQKPPSLMVTVGNKRVKANLARDGKYYTQVGDKYYEVNE